MSRPPADESVFRAIADPTRRRILDLLHAREMTPGEMIEALPGGMGNVTFHLRVLRSAGLVTERRAGQRRIYRIQAKPLRALSAWLSQYESSAKSPRRVEQATE